VRIFRKRYPVAMQKNPEMAEIAASLKSFFSLRELVISK